MRVQLAKPQCGPLAKLLCTVHKLDNCAWPHGVDVRQGLKGPQEKKEQKMFFIFCFFSSFCSC